MALTVYPRLGELLRERDMSVAELTRRIEQRYGRSVDPKTLYRLTTREPIQRVDIALIFQVAAILDLRIDALFDILALTPEVEFYDSEEPKGFLPAAQQQRMRDLFSLDDARGLTAVERAELEQLVALNAQLIHESNVRILATQRGVSVQQVEQEKAQEIEAALLWWNSAEGEALRRSARSSAGVDPH